MNDDALPKIGFRYAYHVAGPNSYKQAQQHYEQAANMVDDIDPAAPPSEMQDLDRILEQDFGIEDILDQQVLALSMDVNYYHYSSRPWV